MAEDATRRQAQFTAIVSIVTWTAVGAVGKGIRMCSCKSIASEPRPQGSGFSVALAHCMTLAAPLMFGQGGNGTITGTVTDPAGAVIPGATVEARNTQTGVVYTGGNQRGGSLYDFGICRSAPMSSRWPSRGFKTYTHSNLALAATQVLREDIGLQAGTAAKSVTVTEQALLLKTETGELTHNVTLEQWTICRCWASALRTPAPPQSGILSTPSRRFQD